MVEPPVKTSNRLFHFLTGFYGCGKCNACHHSKENIKKQEELKSTNTGKNYKIKDFIACSTTGVMLECECGLQYIWHISKTLQIRVAEHKNINKGVVTYVRVSKTFKISS